MRLYIPVGNTTASPGRRYLSAVSFTVILLLLIALLASPPFPTTAPPTTPSPMPMRVLTWNVNRAELGGDAFRQIVEHVRGAGPVDAVALQLVSSDVAAALASALGWPEASVAHSLPGAAGAARDGSSRPPHPLAELFGNAVLSPHCVESFAERQLPSREGLPPRSVLCVDVEAPADKFKGGGGGGGGVLSVCSVHLENTSEDARLEQARAAVDWLVSHRPRHVLCGDLNALIAADFPAGAWEHLCEVAEKRGWEPREQRVMQHLLGHCRYTDAFEAAGVGPTDRGTFFLPPAEAWIRIDYVLLSPSAVEGAHVIASGRTRVDGASNHHPVTADILLG